MRRRLTSGRAIGVALLVAVISFLAATVLTEIIVSRVSGAARSIASNAAPSIDHLSALRSRIQRVNTRLEQLPDTDSLEVDQAGLRWMLADITRRWTEYQRQETYRGERALWPLVEADLSGLSTCLEQAVSALERGDAPGSRSVVRRALAISAHLDALLNGMVLINTSALKREAAAIDEVWREQVSWTVLLHILAVLSAVVAGGLAYRGVRRYEQLLEARNAELEQFASRLSHDLLSPISAATTALDYLGGGSADPRASRIADAGRRGLMRAREIADALLAFALAGGRPSADERARADEIVRDVVDDMRPSAEERGIELSVEPGPESQVACASGLLASAVTNLVGNAIKYMGEAPVRRITVRTVPIDGMVRIEVEDTGPGMPPDARAHIFEPFVRASASGPGVGLGLATVKRIAVGHGGSVDVETAPGGGCRFSLLLPGSRVAS